MKQEKRLNYAIENLEIVSTRLRELLNLINTVHLGLMEENTEKQVLDCIICFFYSVNEIHDFTEKVLKEVCGKENTQKKA